jgi:hypothetical protein
VLSSWTPTPDGWPLVTGRSVRPLSGLFGDGASRGVVSRNAVAASFRVGDHPTANRGCPGNWGGTDEAERLNRTAFRMIPNTIGA